MKLNIGDTIKYLRKEKDITQEELGDILGVSYQSISRWETGFCYPDMALIPSIANYFGVSIDELFGYKNDRDRKIDSIIQAIDAFHIKSRGDGEWVEECFGILCSGLAEFPQNEKLWITLADTLSEAGWRRHQEWL